MQHIKIYNLGPVKEIELDVKRTGLIIGEQALGKSTIAKAIYFSRGIKNIVMGYFFQIVDMSVPQEEATMEALNHQVELRLIQEFQALFGYFPQTQHNLCIQYQFSNSAEVTFRVSERAGKIEVCVLFSDDLKVRLSQVLSYAVKNCVQEDKEGSVEELRRLRRELRSAIRGRTNLSFDDMMDTYYIPAGRSMVTLLSNNRSVLQDSFDSITRRYVGLIESIQHFYQSGLGMVGELSKAKGEDRFDRERVVSWIRRMLKADYFYQPNQEYLILEENGTSIPVPFASSGQQEILWVLNLLYLMMLRHERAFIILEEPEVHLYPSLQDELMRFLLFFQNCTGSVVLLTTHSPYVLTSINSFYCAGGLIERYMSNPKAEAEWREKVVALLEYDSTLLPSQFYAIKLRPDGSTCNLILDDIKEIETEQIDEISDEINLRYERLYEMELTESIGGVADNEEKTEL